MSAISARPVAVIYVRKSLVKKGGTAPASPEMQQAACERRAAELGLTPEVYTDAKGHLSGKNEERPAWQMVRARLRDADVAALIVYAWNRAVRNTRILLELVDELSAAGVRFIATDNQIDTGNAAGRFQLTMMAGVDEYESNVSSERRVSTIDHLRRNKGRHYGLAPFGTMRVSHDGERVLAPSDSTQPKGTDHAALRQVYERWLTQRCSFGAVALGLNADGWRYRNRLGVLRPWRRDDVKRCLQAHWIHAGYVTVGRAYRNLEEILSGSHAPILPEVLTATVGKRLQASHKLGPRQRLPVIHPLSGLLHCGACGEKLACDSNRDHPRYRHIERCATGAQFTFYSHLLEEKVRERIAALTPPPEYMQARADTITRWLAQEQAGGGQENERARVQASLTRLAELYADGGIERSEYDKLRAVYLERLPKDSAPVLEQPAFGLPGLDELARGCSPAILRDIARGLYKKITITDGKELIYEPQDWCAAWA